MFVLVTAALIGGVISTVSLWDYGILIAFGCAPFGGSLLAFVAAVAFSNMRGGPGSDQQGVPCHLPQALTAHGHSA